MAQLRVCDEKHDHPTEAAYVIIEVENDGYHSSSNRDLCALHFRDLVSPYLTGGMKTDTTYTLKRI